MTWEVEDVEGHVLGDCSSGERSVADNAITRIDCTVPITTLVFDCHDNYGDGWEGGFLRLVLPGGTLDICKDRFFSRIMETVVLHELEISGLVKKEPKDV